MTNHPWKYGNEFNVYNILPKMLLGFVAHCTKALGPDIVTDNFVSSNPTTLHIFILSLSHLIANYMI